MMENYSLSDIKSVVDGNGGGFGFGNGGGFIWVILLAILVMPMLMPMMMKMFGGGGLFGQDGATAAAQNEILMGQKFDAIHGKLDDIGHGLCDGFYSMMQVIKECCCNTQLLGKDITANNDRNTATVVSAMTAGFQRVMDNQNGIEMQHLRDAQMRDYIDKSLCGIIRYPMSMSYCTPCNPFCGVPNPCGCNGYQPNI